MNRLAMAALFLAGACGAAHAGGNAGTTMEVSFVIRAACSVQAGPGGAAAPQVECTQGTGYRLERQDAPAPAPSSTTQDGATWQVVF